MLKMLGKPLTAVLVVVVLTCASDLGQTQAGVSGSVIDRLEHAPLSNVYVLAHHNGGEDVHVRTGRTGKYFLQLPAGIYDLLFSADGFSPVSHKVEVRPDGVAEYNVVLEANTMGMQE